MDNKKKYYFKTTKTIDMPFGSPIHIRNYFIRIVIPWNP